MADDRLAGPLGQAEASGAGEGGGALTAPFASPFIGPVKRSITIAGHQTSISLEPVFWAALEQAARGRGVPLSALVAEVDARRAGQAAPPNLASALRCWVFEEVASHREPSLSSPRP